MCKNKWNGLNFDYKKIFDYHVKTNNHTIFYDLTIKEHNYHQLSKFFNQKLYYAIQAFQGDMMINAIGHVRDICIKVSWFNLHTIKYKIGYKRFYYTSNISNAKAFGEWLCV